MLAGCKVRNGICEYDYSIFLREKLANPCIYARINLTMQNRFSSKYSLALYELFVDYKGIGETPVIDIPNFRRLVGLEAEEYKLFKDLNKYIIKKAIREINKHSNLWIEIEYKRSGRTVIGLKFYIKTTKELPPKLPILPKSEKSEADLQLSSENEPEIFSDLEAEFISLKLSKKQAQAIIEKFSPEQIRRNIDLTKKKVAEGEVRNIPGFLTDAIREDYAKDYEPIDEKHQELVSEAKKCWQKTKGLCEATWSNYKDKKSQICHYCKKFADQRKQLTKSEGSETNVNSESLFDFIPIKISKPVRNLILKYQKSHSAEYVIKNIRFTNQHITDKRKYRAILEKNLAENQADKANRKYHKNSEQKKIESNNRFEQHRRIREQLKTMPEKRIKELRAGCLKDLKPFMRKRLENMPLDNLIKHPSFLDYCAENF